MTVDEHAKAIFDYMLLNMPIEKSDAILGLGSSEKRVAQCSSQLLLNDYGDLLIFSGGYGKITQHSNSSPEAEVFKNIALDMSVPVEKILTETKSSNTGDNIRFTENLLSDEGIKIKSLIVVTKPYMERRAYATFKKQWSDKDVKLIVTSPQLSYEDMLTDAQSKEQFINIMVGDLQRIKVFPSLGFQIEQDIPDNIWQSFNALVDAGFTKQLIKD
jgi:uncharacterized SAM-binding protein YcdF (DUF218 family)